MLCVHEIRLDRRPSRVYHATNQTHMVCAEGADACFILHPFDLTDDCHSALLRAWL